MTAPAPAPLQDVRVLELDGGIATSYCTKLLADAGADVVKVEPVGGDPFRRWRSGALFVVNTAKPSAVGSIDGTSMERPVPRMAGHPVKLANTDG